MWTWKIYVISIFSFLFDENIIRDLSGWSFFFPNPKKASQQSRQAWHKGRKERLMQIRKSICEKNSKNWVDFCKDMSPRRVVALFMPVSSITEPIW